MTSALARVAGITGIVCRSCSPRPGRANGSDAAPPVPRPGVLVLHRPSLTPGVARQLLAVATIVTLALGLTATAASAASNPASLRAQVDAIGSRYFAAQTRARALDAELRGLDTKLAAAQRKAASLRGIATRRAVQVYQGSSQGFLALFDVTDAMESTRRAELITRANEHTDALLQQFYDATRALKQQRAKVDKARSAQAKTVAALAHEQAALEAALAQAQQAYLAQQARAKAAAAQQTSTTTRQPVTTPPPAKPTPTAPVSVPPPPPSQPGVNPHHDDPFLVCTRSRESNGNYQVINPAGYYGAYQFSQPTWDVTASHAGSPQLIGVRPSAASPWDQDQLAWLLHQWQGNRPWGGLC